MVKYLIKEIIETYGLCYRLVVFSRFLNMYLMRMHFSFIYFRFEMIWNLLKVLQKLYMTCMKLWLMNWYLQI